LPPSSTQIRSRSRLQESAAMLATVKDAGAPPAAVACGHP
jgi:hypothetical protein